MHIQKHLQTNHSLPDICCDDFLAFDKDEILALIEVLEHQYIDYENSIAICAVQRMLRFKDELDKRTRKAT